MADRRGVDLVLTSGGTGLGPRDVTPEAILPLIEKSVPGIGELMRLRGAEITPTAVLSRSFAGTRGASLIIALPGSPRGAAECLSAVWPAIPHALELLRGEGQECDKKVRRQK
jgi:molybdenum cofactor synthesis domain-containing protein